jgi:hypothetical protein
MACKNNIKSFKAGGVTLGTMRHKFDKLAVLIQSIKQDRFGRWFMVENQKLKKE